MGCGTLEWSVLFEHSLGILEEREDAKVRDHLQSCDTCRASGAELLLISERLRELRAATEAPGRETFADRTRYDARAAMGESRAIRATASWRVATGITDSQRIRRIAVRRRNTLVKVVAIVAAAVAVPVVFLVVLYLAGVVGFAVDRYGGGIEKTLGVDFASWGMRPGFAGTAALARAATSAQDCAAANEAISRLLRRELSVDACRPESVAVLEFARVLAAKADPKAGALVAAAVEHAAAIPAGAQPCGLDALAVVRRGRAFVRAGAPAQARNALELLTVSGDRLALYYDAVAVAGVARDGVTPALDAVARSMPSVWGEVAWRLMAAGKADEARAALVRVPSGAYRDAIAAYVFESAP